MATSGIYEAALGLQTNPGVRAGTVAHVPRTASAYYAAGRVELDGLSTQFLLEILSLTTVREEHRRDIRPRPGAFMAIARRCAVYTINLAVHAHVVDQGRGEERPESTQICEVLTYAPSLQPFAPPARLYISALHLDPHTW